MKKTILVIFIIINIAFVWLNSVLSVEQSHEISLAVKNYLSQFFNFIENSTDTVDFSEHIIRKLAHATEFMSLGILVTAFFGNLKPKRCLLIILFGFFVASMDEFIQIFSGRGSMFKDVLIDTAGFLIGFVIIFCIKYYKSRNINLLN